MQLSEIEKKLLLALKKNRAASAQQLAAETGLASAAVDRAAAWLAEKKLAQVSTQETITPQLTQEGKEYLREKLPERRLFAELENSAQTVSQLEKKLGKKTAGIGVAWLGKLGAITFSGGSAVLTQHGRELSSKKLEHERLLEEISAGKEVPPFGVQELTKRGLAQTSKTIHKTIAILPAGLDLLEQSDLEEEVSQLTQQAIVTGAWKKLKLREYDVTAPTQAVYPGKRHPASQAADYVRRVWVEMGFREMRGPLIDTEFWNFDSLFVPQDHPAREMQDTLFVQGKGRVPAALALRVKKAHESGVAGSLGWGADWNKQTAEKLVLRTHTTVLSAHTLAALKKADWPAKFFALGKCFRNEAFDWKHTAEFNQTEGIVVDADANFSHLFGYLKQYCRKLGFPDARFRPSYFPYTEPSVEIDVFHPVHKKWMELGGAGIFRPEVTEPLLGEPVPVLAWGPGFERLIMNYYAITDVRELYNNDLKQLRESKMWLL